MNEQITTITFFRFSSWTSQIWAFGMMPIAYRSLRNIRGLSFHRLMGSGKELGFNPFPDWSVYCLLQVWESQADAEIFFSRSPLIKRYQSMTSERWTLYMRNISSSGRWINQEPFVQSNALDNRSVIAIITRATIKWRWLRKFWQYVPTAEKPLQDNDGLIYTKGIGEVPILQMATFSLWEDLEYAKKFAYQSKEHQQAIAKTRAYDWYREELFARFQPFRSEGTWAGANPLPDLT